MSSEFNVTVDGEAIEALKKKYGEELPNKVIIITKNYMGEGGIIQAEAKRIIEDAGQVDTNRLIGSIKPSLHTYASRIIAEMNAGTNYARFIHEGAEHKNDTETQAHFVSFATAPGLLIWALRHGVVYRKTKREKRKSKMNSSNIAMANMRGERSDAYYFYSKKTNKEYPINVRKSGMKVSQRPLKFFEIPYEEYAPKYVEELEGLLK